MVQWLTVDRIRGGWKGAREYRKERDGGKCFFFFFFFVYSSPTS